MEGERLARRSLEFDSAYCAVSGTAVVVAAFGLSARLGIPAGVLRGAGIATMAWAVLVGRWSRASDWRLPTGAVAFANGAAAAGLMVAAGRYPPGATRDGLALVGAEVGAFGISQAVALAR